MHSSLPPFACTSGPKNARIAVVGEAHFDMLYHHWVPKRIWDKITPEPNSGCWLWLGAASSANPKIGVYGQTYWEGKVESSHRVIYRLLRKSIPQNLDLDHLCRVRLCCNPWHLEAVDRSTNNFRGNTGLIEREYWKNALTCDRGHPWTADNIVKGPMRRSCKACRRAQQRFRRNNYIGKLENYL